MKARLLLPLFLCSCAFLRDNPRTVETITEAVCLGVTAVTEDGAAHEVCAEAEDLAPFADAILRAQLARKAAKSATPATPATRMAAFRPVRLTTAELAANDCGIPANHPSQR